MFEILFFFFFQFATPSVKTMPVAQETVVASARPPFRPCTSECLPKTPERARPEKPLRPVLVP